MYLIKEKMDCACVLPTIGIVSFILILVMVLCIPLATKHSRQTRCSSFGAVKDNAFGAVTCECRDSGGAAVPTTMSSNTWRHVGKLLTTTNRSFILEEAIHQRHRRRFQYQAKSTDLPTQTTYSVEVNGVDTTDPYGNGANQLFGGETVNLFELNTSARVHRK